MRRLEDRKLVRRERSGRLSVVTLLREDGSGEEYERPPVTPDDTWFNLPYAYWLDEHHRTLSMPAKVMLLIALSLPAGFYLPYERAKPWYGISADSAGRGFRELAKAGLLVSAPQWVKNNRSHTGWIEQRHYTLTAPYAKAARNSLGSTGVDQLAVTAQRPGDPAARPPERAGAG
jgi:hypothetical protein